LCSNEDITDPSEEEEVTDASAFGEGKILWWKAYD
jgi:hypothetical protein